MTPVRTIVLGLLLVLPAFALVPTAAANPCHMSDVRCMIDCLFDDPCGVYDPLDFGQCPAGEGIVVIVDGRPVPACVVPPSLGVGPCPAGNGAVVTLDGRTVPACVVTPTVSAEPCPSPNMGYVITVGSQTYNTCFQ